MRRTGLRWGFDYGVAIQKTWGKVSIGYNAIWPIKNEWLQHKDVSIKRTKKPRRLMIDSSELFKTFATTTLLTKIRQ